MAFSLLGYLYFRLEIFPFLYYANKKSDDVIVGRLKQYSTQSRISLEIFKQCSLNLAPENRRQRP